MWPYRLQTSRATNWATDPFYEIGDEQNITYNSQQDLSATNNVNSWLSAKIYGSIHEITQLGDSLETQT